MVEILHLGIIHNNLHPTNQNGIRSDLHTSAVYASYRPRLEPQEIVLIALRNAYVVWQDRNVESIRFPWPVGQAAQGCVVKGFSMDLHDSVFGEFQLILAHGV